MKVLLIPQLGMVHNKNFWDISKDGNIIIMELVSKLLKEEFNTENYMVLPHTHTIFKSPIFKYSTPIFIGNIIVGSAAYYRFNIDINQLLILNFPPEPDIIITSIPEQVPALRTVFGSKVKIVSILSYVTWNNPTALGDYFLEQYSGLRKSDLCFSYNTESGDNFLKGISDFSLPYIQIHRLNLAYSKEDIINELLNYEGKVLKNKTKKTLFIPTRLSDNKRTKFMNIILKLQDFQERGFDFDLVFANPGNDSWDNLNKLKNIIKIEINDRAIYLNLIKECDAVLIFGDIENHISVAFYEAKFLNHNIITNEGQLERYMEIGLENNLLSDLYSYEKRKEKLTEVFRRLL